MIEMRDLKDTITKKEIEIEKRKNINMIKEEKASLYRIQGIREIKRKRSNLKSIRR